jgi:hypothetical protein
MDWILPDDAVRGYQLELVPCGINSNADADLAPAKTTIQQ